MSFKYQEIKDKGDSEARVKELEKVAFLALIILVELSKPIRKKLGLKKLASVEK